uniref:DSP-PTPase phosphatase fused to NAD+ Kinase domain-containing protein n=1 Tax=Oryza barthii TaxID=65489 RepID=A0A0D3HJ38_9ORYZ
MPDIMQVSQGLMVIPVQRYFQIGFRGGQFSGEKLEWLLSKGFKIIVDLWEEDVKDDLYLLAVQEAVSLGKIEVVNIPVEIGTAPSAKQVQRLTEVVSDSVKKPIYLHCQEGNVTIFYQLLLVLLMENHPAMEPPHLLRKGLHWISLVIVLQCRVLGGFIPTALTWEEEEADTLGQAGAGKKRLTGPRQKGGKETGFPLQLMHLKEGSDPYLPKIECYEHNHLITKVEGDEGDSSYIDWQYSILWCSWRLNGPIQMPHVCCLLQSARTHCHLDLSSFLISARLELKVWSNQHSTSDKMFMLSRNLYYHP